MTYRTIAQVDPIALRKKLARLGIGPKSQFSQTAAMDAARDFGNHAAKNVEFTASDIEVSTTVTGDVDCKCPKCDHEWTMEGVEIEEKNGTAFGVATIEGMDLEDMVEARSRLDQIGPGTCVLEPAEIAYLIHRWAMLWDLPA